MWRQFLSSLLTSCVKPEAPQGPATSLCVVVAPTALPIPPQAGTLCFGNSSAADTCSNYLGDYDVKNQGKALRQITQSVVMFCLHRFSLGFACTAAPGSQVSSLNPAVTAAGCSPSSASCCLVYERLSSEVKGSKGA